MENRHELSLHSFIGYLLTDIFTFTYITLHFNLIFCFLCDFLCRFIATSLGQYFILHLSQIPFESFFQRRTIQLKWYNFVISECIKIKIALCGLLAGYGNLRNCNYDLFKGAVAFVKYI